MSTEIKFGTDGWRGVIADDYTFGNVRRVAGAIAAYVLKNEDPSRGVMIGYDTRFGSRRFAEACADVLALAGVPIKLANDYTPTPALSYAVKNLGAAGGVMITSSHNPWNWNGVKFKANYGGSATPAIIKLIEEAVRAGAMPRGTPARIEEADFNTPYVAAICKFADLDKIAKAGFKFAIDCMYGAGRNILSDIFRQRGIDHVQIRSEVNPLFPGINPEPIEPHVRMLQDTVVKEKCHAGFVTDGDADRIGAVAEDGSFVDAHKIYSILLQWLLTRHNDWPGDVVRAFNTTRMLDRIAAKHGRKLIECGIGFKYICDLMLERQILVGGEESGGIGIQRHLPERDGLLNALLLANVMADEGKSLGQLVAALQQEYGPHYYARRDLRVANDVKEAAISRAASSEVKTLGRYKILRKEDMDGIKFFLDAPTPGDGAEAWVLLRSSGTEPLMRIYTEAASPDLVQEILEEAVAFVEARVPAGAH
ncbi:MAG TPA: phosphoglucomutase/phosphomannomutase family protein [Verrucomicrobiae bacterium]|jgi:phosphomannomutase|nr:phosphoglucomutase/phosphomannomutase family protein [Verrucomicrobiae bacterium]